MSSPDTQSYAEHSPPAEVLPRPGRFTFWAPDQEVELPVTPAMAEQYMGGIMLSYGSRYEWVNNSIVSNPQPGNALLDFTESVVEPLQTLATELRDPSNLSVKALFFDEARLQNRKLAVKEHSLELGGTAVFDTEEGPVAGLLVPHVVTRRIGGIARKLVHNRNYLVATNARVPEQTSQLADWLESLHRPALARLMATTAHMILAEGLPNADQVHIDLGLNVTQLVPKAIEPGRETVPAHVPAALAAIA